MVSAIMNSHIANFLVGMEKGGPHHQGSRMSFHGQIRLAHGAS